MKRQLTGSKLQKRKSSFFQSKAFMAIMLSLVILFLVFLYLLMFTNVFSNHYSLYKIDVAEGSLFDASDDNNIYFLNDSTLKCVNKKGKVLWSALYSSSDMQLSAGGQFICLYNKKSATVLDKNQSPLYTIPESDFSIEKITCGNNALALYCSLENSQNKYIRIFSLNGTEIERLDLGTTSFLNFGFYGESDNLWYLSLDTSGVEPISHITTLMPSQQQTTGSYNIYDQLVTNISFYSTNIYVNTTSSLMVYDTFGDVFFEKMIYGSSLVDSIGTNDNITFAYSQKEDTSSSLSTVRLVSINGLDTLVLLPENVTNVALSQNKIYCFAKNIIYLYNYKGEFIDSIELDFEVTKVSKLSDGIILLKTSDGMYLYIIN